MAIDPESDPFVLLGRVATLGDRGTVDDGAVYIRGEDVVAVEPEEAPAPAGFEGAARVRTGGTIFPGLIELHNHLSYNAIPLWELPRAYLHSGHWQGTDEYKTAVTKPAAVLANTAGNAEALVRFAECRCLLGGVTASQGITLQSNSGVQKLYKGLVRNVEAPLLAGVHRAHARIGAPDKDESKYLEKLRTKTCYLQHLSEGINETARKQFTGLQDANGDWALHPSLCGVHSTALTPEDFEILGQNGCSIVWSPLSNLLLYGQTTDVAAAKAAGVPIALGSDWAPSGSKNLLGELKVAKVVSDHLGGLFTLEELCAMVTTTPAEILGWDHRVGRVEAGKAADLVVIDDTTDDPFEQLVMARETSVTLVMIGGIPRVGQRRLMRRFAGDFEEIRIGSSKRLLDLSTRSGDAELGGLTLAEATSRLADTLERLPECAEELENALASGWVPGRAVAEGGIDMGQLPEDWTEPELRVVLELEEEDGNAEFLEALQAGDLVDWVEPMRLDPITVPDDPTFLKRLLRARNLPLYVKEALPELHGVQLSLPTDESLAEEEADRAAGPLASVELGEFLAEQPDMPSADRLRILEQAILLLERYYVHLPMKRTRYAVDPVQRLRILAHELFHGESRGLRDLDFHREVIAAFDSMRDLHTAYRLPRPYRGKMAWLPYLIEECRREPRADDGDPESAATKLIVSKVISDPGPASFVPGVEVLHWNGVPIARAVEALARQMPGGNRAARKARAMNSLTLRSLTRGQIPDEEWVTLHYRTADGKIGRFKHPWLLFQAGRGRRNLTPEQLGSVAATELGLDDQTDDLQHAKTLFFAAAEELDPEPDEIILARRRRLVASARDRSARGATTDLPTRMPTVFRARTVVAEDGSRKAFGYLRIFTFNVDDADLFVDEMAELLQALPPDGLILDLRGNGGGLIAAAERALELLSPRPIEPQAAQFINSPATLELCRNQVREPRLEGLDLQPWLGSMERAVQSGAPHSLGVPITPPAACNLRGQIYQGPKVLIQDGLCYSAADMFIAGFQDHGLGEIIGLHGNTGAGGANVWSHRLLRFLEGGRGEQSPFRQLPDGADLRIAIRRTLRVGAHAGELVEDFGVATDLPYRMTERDLLAGNQDLVQTAIRRLRAAPAYSLEVRSTPDGLRVAARGGAEWVQITSDTRPVGTYALGRDGKTTVALPLPGLASNEIELVAHASGEPVARARHPMP